MPRVDFPLWCESQWWLSWQGMARVCVTYCRYQLQKIHHCLSVMKSVETAKCPKVNPSVPGVQKIDLHVHAVLLPAFSSQQCNRNIFHAIKYSPTKHLFLMWVPLAWTAAVFNTAESYAGWIWVGFFLTVLWWCLNGVSVKISLVIRSWIGKNVQPFSICSDPVKYPFLIATGPFSGW